MKREYAVLDRDGNMLFRTPGFDKNSVSGTVPLSDGAMLRICGDDGLAEENRRLHIQLQEANAANIAKETFLSNMSHDIRTPMNAIIGMSVLAKKHIDEKPRVVDAINKIEIASAHLLSLVNDVLDMSRINSGRMKLADDLFSLCDLLHDTMTIVRPQIEQKRHTYTLSTDGIVAESFHGDALRLRQIYVNIISNAVKYTDAGGNIRIDISEKLIDSRCRLIFRCVDNGIGMSEQFLSRIFEPFERANSSTMSKIEGTGLGMSIVKKLVEAMDGSIVIKSRPGEGTDVTIDIPLEYEQENVSTDALLDKRLLIIEADEKLREVYRLYLGEYAVRFTLVASASEALSALTDSGFRREEYHAVIIGSESEGSHTVLDTASYLSRSYPALTLVLVSSDNWEEIEYNANRSGIRHFIPLPFFRKSLINGLNQALQSTGGAESGSAYPNLEGKRLLLVEDNMINREIARELLGMTRAEIETAEDGKQAVDMFLASPEGWYDLILMDVQMPVMDGYAATGAIRSSARSDSASIPIYAMTANTFAEDIAKARSAGMNGHIAKPIDVNLLMQTLRQVER